jgi:hypothetical protein
MPIPTVLSTKQLAKASEGPHAHWGFRHMDSEGIRFHQLHKLVAERSPDERGIRTLLKQIRAFARYEAFATCDSHLRRHPDVVGEYDQLKAVFETARDEGYFRRISKSLALLRAEASPAAHRILEEKAQFTRFLSSFKKGVEERQEFSRRSIPTADTADFEAGDVISMAA